MFQKDVSPVILLFAQLAIQKNTGLKVLFTKSA